MRTQLAIASLLIVAACGGGAGSYGDDALDWGHDAGTWNSGDAGPGGGGGGNIGLGGAGDFGFFRELLDSGIVPMQGQFDAAGFFHEHQITLPPPTCGQQVCVQAQLGAIGGLFGDGQMAMLHLGLNTPVTIDPDTRPPLTLAVVVDTSGSMGGEKIEYTRQGLVRLIGELDDGDWLSIVEYNDYATVVAAMGPVAGRRAQLTALAEGLDATTSTNLYDGLELGYREIMTAFDAERFHRVILLSDGVPTAGITSESAILAMSAGFNAQGLGITTIGLGTDFNAPLMRGLAEQGNGNHYFLEDTTAVDEVFLEELRYFAIPVAFDVTLAVQEGSHYAFGQAFGSSFWQDETGGGRVEVPSVFIAHRLDDGDVFGGDAGVPGRRGGGSALLVRLVPREPLPAAVDGLAEVSTIDVSFREPGATALTTTQLVVTHPYGVPDEGVFVTSDPSSTHKVLVMLEAYRAIEIACLKFHTGLGAGGLEVLRRVQAALTDYNDEIADLDIAADLALIEQLAQVLLANGVEEPDVTLPADPWPAD